jgi:hypothetical protein
LGVGSGVTTPSPKTIIVKKPYKNCRPVPKIRRPRAWKKKYDLWLAAWSVGESWRLIAKDRTEWGGIVMETKPVQGQQTEKERERETWPVCG